METDCKFSLKAKVEIDRQSYFYTRHVKYCEFNLYKYDYKIRFV